MCDRCVFSHIKLNECHHYPACLIAGIIQHDNLEKHKMTTSDEWFKLDCVLKKFRLSLFIIIFFYYSMLIFMWVSTTFWPTGLLKNFTLVYLICLLIMSTDSSVQTCMLSFFILSGEICPFSQSHKNFHQISYHVFCLIVFCDGKNIHKGLSIGGVQLERPHRAPRRTD